MIHWSGFYWSCFQLERFLWGCFCFCSFKWNFSGAVSTGASGTGDVSITVSTGAASTGTSKGVGSTGAGSETLASMTGATGSGAAGACIDGGEHSWFVDCFITFSSFLVVSSPVVSRFISC